MQHKSIFLLNFRYHLKGPKKGSLEVINNNLPGIPDNIRRSSTGGYWIGMALIRKKNKFSFFDYCAEKPWLRSLIMKVSIIEIITFELMKWLVILKNVCSNNDLFLYR